MVTHNTTGTAATSGAAADLCGECGGRGWTYHPTAYIRCQDCPACDGVDRLTARGIERQRAGQAVVS